LGQLDPPWHVRDPAALATLENELATAYPTLHVVSTAERVLIKGAFPVRDGTEVLDWYSVEIELAPDHPRTLPRVREVGGRIPWILDRHVLSDGSACVVLPDAYWLENPTGRVSIPEFLVGPVRDFFLGQSVVDLGYPWPQGEWAHGARGLVQHYTKTLGVESIDRICQILLATAKPLKGHLPCLCGSGRRYRDCHRAQVNLVRDRVPQSVVLWTIEVLLKHLEASRGTTPSPK
jgi:hypothetical protein